MSKLMSLLPGDRVIFTGAVSPNPQLSQYTMCTVVRKSTMHKDGIVIEWPTRLGIHDAIVTRDMLRLVSRGGFGAIESLQV